MRRPSYELLSYGDPAGYRPLREAIAAYVRTARAVRCDAEQEGDAEGVLVDVVRLVRLALIEWASQHGAWIVEDDYDSEFRYRSKPLPSLQGLDAAGRVIYLGTFSKTLFPSLRLGFVVLPPELVDPFRRARSVVDGHSPVSEQAVLAEFIAGGHFARHIRRMRVLYGERQAVLVDAARRELAGALDVRPLDGGMHLVGWLPEGADDVAIAEQAAARGVHVVPLSVCSALAGRRCREAADEGPGGRAFSPLAGRRCREAADEGRHSSHIPPGLLLGYAALTPAQIREGVRKLAAALRACT